MNEWMKLPHRDRPRDARRVIETFAVTQSFKVIRIYTIE